MKIFNRYPHRSNLLSKNLFLFSDSQPPLKVVTPGRYKFFYVPGAVTLKDNKLMTSNPLLTKPAIIKIHEYNIAGLKAYALQEESTNNWVNLNLTGNSLGRQLFATKFEIKGSDETGLDLGLFVFATLTLNQKPLRFLGTGLEGFGKQLKLVENLEPFKLLPA